MYSVTTTKFPCHTNHATFNKLIIGVHSFAHKQKHSSSFTSTCMLHMPFYSSLVSHIIVPKKAYSKHNGSIVAIVLQSQHQQLLLHHLQCTPLTVILSQKVKKSWRRHPIEWQWIPIVRMRQHHTSLSSPLQWPSRPCNHTKTHHYYILNWICIDMAGLRLAWLALASEHMSVFTVNV